MPNEKDTLPEEVADMADERMENQNVEETSAPEVPASAPAAPPKSIEDLKKPLVPQPGEELQKPYVPQPDEVMNQQPQPQAQPQTAAPAAAAEDLNLVDFAAPNLDLMMNVPMQLSVEIGRAKRTLREILELHKDSLVLLDKAAGEAVDLYVNGSLVAKGEVVVVDEHFGIRVTEVVSNSEMLNTL